MRPHAHVIGAGPRDLADLGQLLAHLGASRYQPLGGQRLDVRGDLLPGPGVSIGPTPALDLVAGLHVPGALGIIWPRPALAVVPVVAQRVEQPFMARWGDVERLPAAQLDAGGQRVDVYPAIRFAVQHRAAGVLIGIEARERRRLPIVDDLVDLLRGRGVVRCPGDDAGRVAPLVRAGVGHLSDEMRVAAQHRDLLASLAVVVVAAQQVAHGTASAALPVSEKPDMHA